MNSVINFQATRAVNEKKNLFLILSDTAVGSGFYGE